MAATPVVPADNQRFAHLQAYLADGWDVAPPIFVRPVWHNPRRRQDAYHFILKRSGALHLVVVPCSPEVDCFVAEQRYPLNHL